MWQKIKDVVMASKPLQFLLLFILGVGVGAFFYPTKHIEETVSKKYEQILEQEKEQHATETKTLQENMTKQEESFKQTTTELQSKVSTLSVQVTQLKSKQKTSYYKIVKPDGTVEIKKYSESDVDESTKVITQIQQEFNEKISSIETKWETIHKQRVEQLQSEFDSKEKSYQQTIATLESKKVEDINPKKAGLEVGVNSNKNVYLHPSYDLFGPLFIGVNVEGNPSTGGNFGGGAGLGIKF